MKYSTTAAPDFNFTLTSADAFLRVFVDAGSQDTTLVINRPDGSWVCADDTYGQNPGIDFNHAQPGLYNVWVGSYQATARAAGSVHITARASGVPGARAAAPPAPASGGPAPSPRPAPRVRSTSPSSRRSSRAPAPRRPRVRST